MGSNGLQLGMLRGIRDLAHHTVPLVQGRSPVLHRKLDY